LGLRISIYDEPASSGIGGSEFVAASLAETLAKDHQVDLFHHIPWLTSEKLAQSCGTDLSNVGLRYVPTNGGPLKLSRRNPFGHYKDSRSLNAELSESYDLFIAIVHGVPPFCHAARGALIVLFPTPTAPYREPQGGLSVKLALRHPARCLYQHWEWARRMKSYQLKTAISDFSRRWTQRRWRIDCQIVYPPVDTRFRRIEKENIILSVGRFAIEGEGYKKQEQMLAAFHRMKEQGLTGWQYVCAGGLSETPKHYSYFKNLSTIAAGSGAQLIANVERAELERLYERASIFWHAAGYGEDENTRPVFLEHFGISTVEAMAAGCVPVVIKKGGQAEIVEHGVSGFLWETLDELTNYTDLLLNDNRLLANMSEAARKRAQRYSRESFIKNFLGRLLPTS
jgi:glycosyltransferase involved in cell wall biosynthesis